MDSSSLSRVSGAAATGLSAASIILIVRLVYFDLYICVVTHWKALAAAAEPPVPEDLLPEVIPALEKLEAALRVLEREVPPETLLWNGPEEQA
jgi:hypothetical protein